jgi:hypothetical protein
VVLGAGITYSRGGSIGAQARDPSQTLAIRAAAQFKRERRIEFEVDAPRDPEIELFTLSPHTDSPYFSLREYLDRYLEALRADLADDPQTAAAADQVSQAFYHHYGPYVEGAGEIHAQLNARNVQVMPGEPVSVSVTLHAEREGPMFFALGGRWVSENSEGIVVSEVLPLRFPAIAID